MFRILLLCFIINKTTGSNYLNKNKYIDIYTNYANTNEIIENLNSKFVPKPETNIQKISRSLDVNTNSKQLETNENFFTKINSVIRNQFSRFFHFGEKNTSDTQKNRETLDKPEKRFLNIFTVLQFDNLNCVAQNGAQNFEGTCYHRLECANRGGVGVGSCAAGYGVCCAFRYTCNGVTSQNVSYFECNPDLVVATMIPTTLPPTTIPSIDPRINYTLPYEDFSKQSAGTNACIFTVNKRVGDVKQLRIDFLDFDVRGPTNGNCVTDSLVITGGNTNMQIPVICGYNTGQHLYVDVSDVPGPIQLSVFVANPAEKKFRLKISQIRAPCANFMNCLQYYTGASGVIQSFNYDPSPRGLGPATYFNNLNYAICIRKEPGFCTITYSNVQNNVESPFRFVNVDANGNMLIPPGQAGVEIFNCPDDYIVINGIRLCGDRLNDGSRNPDFRQNAPVTDFSGGPFVLPVRTNAQNVARGFKLFYQQNRCGS